jgi:predicted dehydrogenase
VYNNRDISRRGFAKAVTGLAAAPMIVPSSVLGQRAGAVAPSDKIVMGGIGIGVRGETDLQAFLSFGEMRFVAVADVSNARREAVKTMVDARYKNHDCVTYSDQYELLARKDIDAVLIATGDRWHAVLAIIAAQHGKDVYCEKPLGMSIAEAKAIPPVFRRYGRIFQAGCQRRNGGNVNLAVELAHTGRLGKLQAVYADVGPWQSWPPLPARGWLPAEPEPPKSVLDWDRWLGPSLWRPYNSKYLQKWGWVNVADLYNSGLLDWGAHTIDLCHWAAQKEDTQPVEYVPEGDNYSPFAVHCTFADGVKLEMVDEGRQGLHGTGACAVRFVGDEGWVETGDTGKVEVSENLRHLLRPTTEARLALAYHQQDFLNSVRSRTQPRANPDVVCNSHVSAHAAFIAFQLGRKVTWDPVKGEFPGDKEANSMRSRAMRAPWRV